MTSEPAGLSLSLDALIEKSQKYQIRGGGAARGGSSRGWGRKPDSEGRGGGGGRGGRGFDRGRGREGAGRFNAGGRGGYTGVRGGGISKPQHQGWGHNQFPQGGMGNQPGGWRDMQQEMAWGGQPGRVAVPFAGGRGRGRGRGRGGFGGPNHMQVADGPPGHSFGHDMVELGPRPGPMHGPPLGHPEHVQQFGGMFQGGPGPGAPQFRPQPPPPAKQPPQGQSMEMDTEELDAPLECYKDEEGNVIVEMENSPIVHITPAGEVTLNTYDYWDITTVNGMNRVLSAIGCKITYRGAPEDGTWNLVEGSKLQLFQDGMTLPARSASAASRGPKVFAVLTGGSAAGVSSLAAAASAASSAAAAELRGVPHGNTMNSDQVRRLKAQGRL